MKFSTSSQALQQVLSAMGKVISSKNTYPILDYFLLELKGAEMKITSSDLETTMIRSLEIDNVERQGSVAMPSKLILDTLKEFADMPLTFDVDEQTWEIKISWKSGSLSIPGANPNGYPSAQELAEEKIEFEFAADKLLGGLNKTIFATADDDLRPVMNGILFNIEPEQLTFVATDAHKMVKVSEPIESQLTAQFILPKKPASLLRGVLARMEENVKISFDSKSAIFNFGAYKIVCRLIEGNFPNYNAVIPTNNPNKALVDRLELLNSIRRVAVCSNPATNLIRLDLSSGSISLQTQDLDFSVSANESLSCNYDGNPLTIGFKSTFLVEILNNIDTENVAIELGDSTRAGVFKPFNEEQSSSAVLMLLMPMMINS